MFWVGSKLSFFFFLFLLEIEPRVLQMFNPSSATELHAQPWALFSISVVLKMRVTKMKQHRSIKYSLGVVPYTLQESQSLEVNQKYSVNTVLCENLFTCNKSSNRQFFSLLATFNKWGKLGLGKQWECPNTRIMISDRHFHFWDRVSHGSE